MPFPVSVLPSTTRPRQRTALLASADASFRQRLSEILTGLRWQVHEAESGAQAWAAANGTSPEAIIVDSWLPDLDLAEFVDDFHGSFPEVDLVTMGDSSFEGGPRGPFHQELLFALQRSQNIDTAAWKTAPALTGQNAPNKTHATDPGAVTVVSSPVPANTTAGDRMLASHKLPLAAMRTHGNAGSIRTESASSREEAASTIRLPELIGNAACMLEISRRVRLVAPRSTPVLIEGPTGSGKELVAEAVHRLSHRSRKPFVAINCAAIPEALLEAELFGHTRGAFTGAVQGRTGRIESADGGTLFLDEIGEMPLSLQSKLLRFVECGELQRVGENETVKVDARIIAATHRPLAQQTQTGAFRSDLYYRLAVFLIRTPSLAEHAQDLPLLVNHFMQRMGRDAPVKRVDSGALAMLAAHEWPGNVRELEHVLERGAILAGDEAVLTANEIDFGNVVH
jgi:DNA-binding NtrC family response regulator